MPLPRLYLRRIPVPGRVTEALLELADSNPWQNAFVFYGYKQDQPISKSEVEKSFNDTVHKIGISEVERRRRRLTFHTWRHLYNTMTRGNDQDPCYRIAILPDRAMTIIR